MLAVLGRSWGLCWRSWAALGAYVGGLGDVLVGVEQKWSVLEGGQGRKVDQARVGGQAPHRRIAGMDPTALKPSTDLFKRQRCKLVFPVFVPWTRDSLILETFFGFYVIFPS